MQTKPPTTNPLPHPPSQSEGGRERSEQGDARNSPQQPPSPTTTSYPRSNNPSHNNHPLSREPSPSPSQGEIKRGSQGEGTGRPRGAGHHSPSAKTRAIRGSNNASNPITRTPVSQKSLYAIIQHIRTAFHFRNPIDVTPQLTSPTRVFYPLAHDDHDEHARKTPLQTPNPATPAETSL